MRLSMDSKQVFYIAWVSNRMALSEEMKTWFLVSLQPSCKLLLFITQYLVHKVKAHIKRSQGRLNVIHVSKIWIRYRIHSWSVQSPVALQSRNNCYFSSVCPSWDQLSMRNLEQILITSLCRTTKPQTDPCQGSTSYQVYVCAHVGFRYTITSSVRSAARKPACHQAMLSSLHLQNRLSNYTLLHRKLLKSTGKIF